MRLRLPSVPAVLAAAVLFAAPLSASRAQIAPFAPVIAQVPAVAAVATPVTAPAPAGLEVWNWSPAGSLKEASLAADGRGSEGLAAFDLGADGVAEILVGSGAGAAPSVRALRADGSQIFAFTPFAGDAGSGVRVAAGDLDGDAKIEIVAAAGQGAPGIVRAFDAAGTALGDGFYPYGAAFRGGIALAVGDFNGDGGAEIATLPASGGAPHVKIWKKSGRLLGEFSALASVEAAPAPASAAYDLAAGDADGDGKDELYVLSGGAASSVRALDAVSGTGIREFSAGASASSLGVGDLDGDGRDEAIVAGAAGAVRVYSALSGTLLGEFASSAALGGPVRAAAMVGPSGRRIAVAPATAGSGARPELAKYIEVDISEQRVRLYEYGRLVRSTLVATGLLSHPTPIGNFSILEKPYLVHYAWSYGPGNPANYDLGLVPFNLRFYPHVYLHYAPWRKVFGVRGSHGCVNLSKEDAEWIYGWAEVGTPVTVKP